jgi:hypothetical protein
VNHLPEKRISLENGVCPDICAYDQGKKLAFLLPFPPYGISSAQPGCTGMYTIVFSWFNENMNHSGPINGDLSLLTVVKFSQQVKAREPLLRQKD